MTNGVAAALLLSNRILGGQPARWASAFDSWSPHELSGLSTALKLNAEVGWQMARGWAAKPCSKAPVCTHLGGVLSWNDAEQSWDCPLHGSRFDLRSGKPLNLPATEPVATFPVDVRDGDVDVDVDAALDGVTPA